MPHEITKIVIQKAARLLREGKLVAFPTETVYGLGADASNPQAVKKIFAAKRRPADHPVIVHLADVAQIHDWAREIPSIAWCLIKQFWPGPLTLVLPRTTQVSDIITGGQNTVGLRIPNHPIAQALLKTFGGGIAAPSANRFGRISPTHAHHVQQELGNAVDKILDGGPTPFGIESTILDLSSEHPRVLRPGIITAKQISEVIGCDVDIIDAHKNAPRSPGTLATHYAPNTPVQIINPAKLKTSIEQALSLDKSLVVLALHSPPLTDPRLHWIIMPEDPRIYAHKLYANLREADEKNHALIFVEEVPHTEIWFAINDRLTKASNTFDKSILKAFEF